MVNLAEVKLYGILDTGYMTPEAMPKVCQQMLEGGVGIIQVRAKRETPAQVLEMLKTVHPITQEAGIPLVVNDFHALHAFAEGVHVGQDDVPIHELRSLLPQHTFIGKSTHSLAQAVAAQAQGVEYIGFGPLFPTPTKAGRPAIGLEEIAQVHAQVSIPIFCIGGIKRDNLPMVIAAGARRVVIVSGLLQADDITSYAQDCLHLLGRVG
jgi:thiamine-phosphate pyrophosphorylase